MININLVSETSLLIDFGNEITPQIADTIAISLPIIRQVLDTGLVDIIPAYTTVLVEFDSLKTDVTACVQMLTAQLQKLEMSQSASAHTFTHSMPKQSHVIEIPVYYGDEVALDKASICAHTHLSFDEVIHLHSQQEYRVYALGFTLGFAYLGNTDMKLNMSRKNTPSFCIPKGSVAIADQQTAIYPKDSPGGWQVLGRTPLELVDFYRDNLTLFSPGDKVRFRAISRATFLSMGGSLDISDSKYADLSRQGGVSC